LFIGIDVGSQSLKAVVLDRELRVIGQGRQSYPIEFPKPGWAQQDVRLWEAALAPAIAEALAAAGHSARDITAVGLAGQLDGCIALDRAGRPLAPCIIWMDRRADGDLDRLRAGAVDFRRRTGANLDGTHMAPKARWLMDHEAASARIGRFHQPVSYLVERLTGETVIDHGLASTSLVYDLATGDYADDLLDCFQLDRAQFPRLAASESLAGRINGDGAALTGLSAGIPVAVGTGDDFSTPLGAGIAQPGILADVLGTAEVVGGLHAEPLIDTGGLVETHRFVGSRLYYIENPGWVSGGALEWLRSLLSIADFAGFDRLAGEAPAGAEGLTFLPALTGAMTPEWNAGARGCFYGLTPSHGPAHLARAALEGNAFGMRDVAMRLRAMGVPVDRARVLGGGGRSRLWAQIRADILGLPVERSAVTDSSAVGAGLLAAVACGAFADVTSAAARLGAVAETHEPDSTQRDAYDQAHGRYLRLFHSLRPMFSAPS
jgi:xylulokinase